jgi:hypothetical protein
MLKKLILFLISLIIISIILSLSVFLNASTISSEIPEEIDRSNYVFTEPESTGNIFYIDPENGTNNGDGSEENPWRTLQEVLENKNIEYYKHSESNNPESSLIPVNENAPVKGNDTLILKNGYHRNISLNNFIFEDWLTIKGAEDELPTLSQFKLEGAFSNIYIKLFIILL